MKASAACSGLKAVSRHFRKRSRVIFARAQFLRLPFVGLSRNRIRV
jgi:hypothetical protein